MRFFTDLMGKALDSYTLTLQSCSFFDVFMSNCQGLRSVITHLAAAYLSIVRFSHSANRRVQVKGAMGDCSECGQQQIIKHHFQLPFHARGHEWFQSQFFTERPNGRVLPHLVPCLNGKVRFSGSSSILVLTSSSSSHGRNNSSSRAGFSRNGARVVWRLGLLGAQELVQILKSALRRSLT